LNNPKTVIPVVALVILVAGGGSFYAGMQYQKSQPAAGRPMAENRLAMHERFGTGERPQGQGRPVNGEIIDQDEKSITIKLLDGGSQIIFISDSTQVVRATLSNKDDLNEGVKVCIFGSENPDGSMSATHIQAGELGDQLPVKD